jgi:RNA recognition motif-containing protein
MNIYVGNLAREVSDEQLREAFQKFGVITTLSVIKDKFSGEPRGYAFIEMANKEEGEAAIRGLNGTELGGKALTVNEARPKTERKGGGGGRGGRGRGGFGGRDRRSGGGGGGNRRF